MFGLDADSHLGALSILQKLKVEGDTIRNKLKENVMKI